MKQKTDEILQCAACETKLGEKAKRHYGEELVDALYVAWAIGGKGDNNLWCYECLDNFMGQHANGHLNSYPVRWRWENERAVFIYSAEEMLEMLVADMREIDWMSMGDDFKDSCVRVLGTNNYHTEDWYKWRKKKGIF